MLFVDQGTQFVCYKHREIIIKEWYNVVVLCVLAAGYMPDIQIYTLENNHIIWHLTVSAH